MSHRDVEQVANFEIVNVQRKSLTYSVKQMLSREIELEKLRQYESNLGPVTTPTVTIEEIEEPKVIKPPPNAAMTLALKPKPIAESCKVSPSFSQIYVLVVPDKRSFQNPIDESFLKWKKVVVSD